MKRAFGTIEALVALGTCAVLVLATYRADLPGKVLVAAASRKTVRTVNGLRFNDLQPRADAFANLHGEQTVWLAGRERAFVRVDVASNGTGLLTIEQNGVVALDVPIYDAQAEGDTYEVVAGEMLTYDFEDTNGDGQLDLRVRGIRVRRTKTKIVDAWTIDDTYRYTPLLRCWRKTSAPPRRPNIETMRNFLGAYALR